MGYIITLLMVIASGAYYLGGISYVAVGALILINLLKNRLPASRYLIISCFLLFFTFNLIRVSVISNFDLVALNFLLQIVFLMSIDFKNIRFMRCILASLKIQITISVVLCIFGFLTGNMYMFVDAGSAKGFSGLYAARGIFSTPQLLASVCLALLVFVRYGHLEQTSSKRKYLFLLPVIITTINRINIIGLLSVFLIALQKSKRKYIVYLVNTLIIGVFSTVILSLDFAQIMSIQTIESRTLLLEGVINSININSITSVIFGDFEKIYFYIPQYLTGVTYVENGFLFLLKYYGAIGLLLYIMVCAVFICRIKSRVGFEMSFYAFFYLFIVQNFTNEFLVVICPEIIALMIFSSYQFREIKCFSNLVSAK